MTFTEAVYDATEIELIDMPDWQRMKCEHRVSLGFRPHPGMASNVKQFRRGEPLDLSGVHILAPQQIQGDHHIEPEVKIFQFADAGLLFDLPIKWWYCAGKKQLTFCWHPIVEENIVQFGMLPISPVVRITLDQRLVFDCVICGNSFGHSDGNADDIDFILALQHIMSEHYGAVVQFNEDMREIARHK